MMKESEDHKTILYLLLTFALSCVIAFEINSDYLGVIMPVLTVLVGIIFLIFIITQTVSLKLFSSDELRQIFHGEFVNESGEVRPVPNPAGEHIERAIKSMEFDSDLMLALLALSVASYLVSVLVSYGVLNGGLLSVIIMTIPIFSLIASLSVIKDSVKSILTMSKIRIQLAKNYGWVPDSNHRTPKCCDSNNKDLSKITQT